MKKSDQHYKLKIIVPVNNDTFCQPILDTVQAVRPPDVAIDIEAITEGTTYIESRCDLALNAPHVMTLAQETEAKGYHGIFVTDMDMCGVEASRELINIPIIGGFRASSYAAMMLGQKFSIITVEDVRDLQDEHIRAFGDTVNLASIRPLKKKVLDLSSPETVKLVNAEALKAVTEDGADCIFFGCTGFIGVADKVAQYLKEKLNKNIPVIDPNRAAISFLVLLIRNQLSQSRITYPKHHSIFS